MMTAMPIATLAELLRVRAETLGAQAAYRFLADGETESAALSYAALDAQARQLAERLRTQVAPGARVLLAFPSGLEFIVAFFGCVYAGVIAVPVCAPHPRKGNERLAAIAADSGACLVLTTPAGARLYAATATQVDALAALDVLALENEENGVTGVLPVTLRPESIAFLQYTSGSTQRPRGVMVTHANLLANLAAIHAAEGNSTQSRGLSWLPAYHDMGLIEGVLQPLYGGYPTWLMPHAAFLQRPARWLSAITRYRATVSGGPNFAYDLCLRRVSDIEFAGLDLGSWQVAYCGAEPVRAETLEAFAARFGRCGLRRSALRPVYGLAEATLLVSASRRVAPGPRIVAACKSLLEDGRFEPAAADRCDRVELVSCGLPARGTRVAIVAPDGDAELPEGVSGEIRVCGPGVAQGYFAVAPGSDHPFATAARSGNSGQWLRTGDLGFLLAGELYVTGRIKDLIILRGRKLHPQDLELTAARADTREQIEAVAAFALDHGGVEGVALCVELRRALAFRNVDEPGLAELADDIREQVYREHDIAVVRLAFVPARALARTSSGKLMRYRCRADLTAGRLAVLACFDAGARLPHATAAA